jgi:phage tail sheath protein FI
MRNFLSPGVYQAPPTSTEDDTRLVRTDIAGFVGYAERGPIAASKSPILSDPTTLAIRLTSWKDYRTKFGGFTRYAYLPYAVRAFFENGGTTCYVVRVAGSTAGDLLSNPQAAYFTLPLGDAAAQVTTVIQSSGVNLTVASTLGLVAGTVIGVGLAGELQPATIASVANGQSLTVTSQFSLPVAAGAPVWLLMATTLSAQAFKGQTDLQVANSSFFQPGDTVAITSDGMIQVAAIDAIIAANTVRLNQKLRGNYTSGSLVRKQTIGLRIEALSPGNWGNRLHVNLTPLQPGFSCSVFNLQIALTPGPDRTQPPEAETFLNLSLSSSDSRSAESIINDEVNGSNLIRLRLPSEIKPFSVINGQIFPFPVTLAGGRDGLSNVTARDFIGADSDFRGLRVLEEVNEVGILAAPDAVNTGQAALTMPAQPAGDPCQPPLPQPPTDPVVDDPTSKPPQSLPNFGDVAGVAAIYQAMIDQARRLRYRVAVFDTPDNLEPTAVTNWIAAQGLPQAFLQFGAAYYPWVLVPDGLTDEQSARRVPTSGHVAGVYAQVDNSVGVQHPPANIELQFAVDVAKEPTVAKLGNLNEKGINVIRAFPGRGIRVWGARSLAAAFDQQAAWWFIHVRRTLSMIEDSVEKSMQWTVFELNDDKLRRTLTH